MGVSRAVLTELLADGMSANNCRVIPNGIDANRLSSHPPVDIRARFGISPQDLLLLSVGSLIRRKGMDLLIETVARLHGNEKKVTLVIVGDGEERESLAQLITERHLQKHVFLAGESTLTGGWLRGGADIFISAAREEAFGLVLAEAGWAGLPVIATAVGGVAEVVQDRHTGILVPPDDVNALAHGIKLLQDNLVLREQLGQQGQARVCAQFSVHRYATDLIATYQFLLQSPDNALAWRDGIRCLGGCLSWLGQRAHQRLQRKPSPQ